MKIAIIDPSLFTLPYDESLCLALQAQGHEVTLYGRPPRADEPEPHTELAFEPLYYTHARAAEDFWEPLRLGVKAADHVLSSARLFQRLESARPDVIHFQWTPFPAFDIQVFPRLARLAPLMLTVHDTRPFNDRPSAALQRLGARRIYDGFCHLIVHTQAGVERLVAQGVSRAKLACIPHGPLGEGLGNPGSLAASTRDGRLNVLLVGKLKPYKGADVLIRAASLLPPALRGRARFVIAGKPYMDATSLQGLARELGIAEAFDFDLRFLPNEALADHLAQAAILAFPYREIEASGVFFAALSYGKPIIASRLGCFAELLGEEVHGLLVPPDDPLVLSHALARLIAEDATRLRMGEAVAALGRSIPSWEEIATRTLALYQHAIVERRRRGDAQLRPVAQRSC